MTQNDYPNYKPMLFDRNGKRISQHNTITRNTPSRYQNAPQFFKCNRYPKRNLPAKIQ